MTNKKFKMAAMSLALTACVAASPLAANAESPENASDAAQPSAVQNESEPEASDAAAEPAAEKEEPSSAQEQEPAVPAAEEIEAPAADLPAVEEAADEEAPEAEDAEAEPEQPAEEVAVPAVLPAVAEEKPVVIVVSDEKQPEEKTDEDKASDEEKPEEKADEDKTSDEEKSEEKADEDKTSDEEKSEEKADEDKTSDEEKSEEKADEDKTSDEEKSEEKADEDKASDEEKPEEKADEGKDAEEEAPVVKPADSADISADVQPSIQLPTVPGESTGVANDYGISTLLPTGGTVAVMDDKVATVLDKDGNITGQYNNFDEAVKEAEDGGTIQVTKDTETEGMNLSKNLTIEGVAQTTVKTNDDGTEEKTTVKPKLTFTKNGIALWGKSLTFKNLQVEMKGVGSTPYTSEWGWMTICASKDASLTLDNTDMVMDGTGTKSNTHAIYFCSNNKLNIQNGSNLTIKNYGQDALEWDGGDGGYNCNVTGGSTYTSDNNRSGFTGTFYVTVDDSDVNVINSTGNGSNGSYFNIKNDSDVLFDNNTNWGISAWRIDMSDGSTLTATNNGYSGIWTRVLNVDKTCTLDVEGNGRKAPSSSTNAGIFFQGNKQYKSTIEEGANVTIKNNAGSGIYTGQKVCDLTIGSATITNNGFGTVNKNGIGASKGGGIYNIGTIKLGPNVLINNNAASEAGADLYVGPGGKLTFSVGNAGTGDTLNKGPDDADCGHKIDGWYIDANGNRWNFDVDADSAQAFLDSLGELPEGVTVSYDQATGLYTITVSETAKDGFALKAAHAELPVDPDPDDPDPIIPDVPTPVIPKENTPVLPENPELPPVQDAQPDVDAETPVLPENPVLPAVQDAHALPQTGTSLFAALAMALSGIAMMAAGAWASLTGKHAHH